MKDREARTDIYVLKRLNEDLTREMLALQRDHLLLIERFNALFDAVAEDLGYRAETQVVYPAIPLLKEKISPRLLAKTVPAAPTIIRTPTARCKGKGK